MFLKISIYLFVLWVCFLGIWCSEEADFDAALMEETEQTALFSAIQGFVGNWWNGSDLYPDPCGWTPIQGVSCDIYNGYWYVTSLSIGPIHDNSLSCAKDVKFSDQLFELKHLKSLSFFNCFKSTHQTQVTIHDLKWLDLAGSLESLEFRSNRGLTGQVPTVIGGLTKLQSLVLIENKFTGQLPQEIGNLSNLKRLVLSENGFTGYIPESYGWLSELLIFDASRNSLSGSLPLTIGELTSLLKLDLSNNQLSGKIPEKIKFLKNLTLLDLRNNKISGGFLKSLQEMDSLTELVLSNNPLNGDLMGIEWGKFHNLVILDLTKTGLSGGIPVSISKMEKLRFLGLGNNNLTGHISPKIASLPFISAFYINGNDLTGKLGFSEWYYMKMGRRFGAWGNPNLCYPNGLVSKYNVPFGVKPCHEEMMGWVNEQDSINKIGGNENLNEEFSLMASLGYSSYIINGFWWIILVEILLLTVLVH